MLHQMMLNADGRRRGSVVGYAASRSSESYSSEQQVVEYRSSSPRVSSPKKIMNYKDPETFSRGSPFLVPWSSPRAGNDVDHRAQEFSPRKPSPPKYGNNDRRVVFQEFSPPRKASSPNYGNNDHRVVQEFSPQKASSPNYGKSSEQRFHGNKQADYYSSNYKGYDDDSDEYEEEDDDDYYDYYDDGLKGKNRVHVRDDHIMKDNKQGKSHYDSSSGKSKHNQGINSYNNNNTHDPPYDHGKYYKGSGEYSSSPRNSNYGAGPFSNKPKKETYYEPSHGGNNTNNSGLAPIKTRRPTNYSNRVTDYPDELAERTKNTNPKATRQPKYNSSAGSKDQREETIDSNEARRRYGRSSPRAGPTVEERNRNTIDSREAARRYNGVFVT